MLNFCPNVYFNVIYCAVPAIESNLVKKNNGKKNVL